MDKDPTTQPISIERLRVRLGGRSVLNDFSLTLNAGEKVALTGFSGSGKSTVLRSILGLVVPEEGNIRVFGHRLDGRSVWALRRHLAYVAQEPDLGTGSADEALRRPFSFRANAALRGNLDRLPEWLDRFRLPPGLLAQPVPSLSGGEKQRVALIAAILLARPIVLLDEASSALDEENRRIVSDYFVEDRETAVLSVSHDREWQGFCTRTARVE